MTNFTGFLLTSGFGNDSKDRFRSIRSEEPQRGNHVF
jgi:hypothetical protein